MDGAYVRDDALRAVRAHPVDQAPIGQALRAEQPVAPREPAHDADPMVQILREFDDEDALGGATTGLRDDKPLVCGRPECYLSVAHGS